jgi:energy-coupling factor transporter ATP-binding protein EcfA2
MFYYQGYGVSIHSELALPALMSLSKDQLTLNQDVIIKKTTINPDGLDSPFVKGLFYQMTEEDCWIHIPNLVYFLLSKGSEIHFSLYPGVDEAEIEELVLSIALPALLLQRGMLVLRGSAIQVGDGCVVITGNSGAGKSTLAAGLLKRGHNILSDEFCVLSNNRHVLPGMPYIKLWQRTLKQLDIEFKDLRPVRPKLRKFQLPLKEHFVTKPLRLSALYFLNDINEDTYSFNKIDGIRKINFIKSQISSSAYLQDMAKSASIMREVMATAEQVPMFAINRPSVSFDLTECLDYIEAELEEKETHYE